MSKFRIMQKGRKFYPQYSNGSQWSDFTKFRDGTLSGFYPSVIEFDSLKAANDYISEYIASNSVTINEYKHDTPNK